MERFVQLVVAGGIALVAGLWTLRLVDGAGGWFVGAALVAVGVAALAVGIRSELAY